MKVKVIYNLHLTFSSLALSVFTFSLCLHLKLKVKEERKEAEQRGLVKSMICRNLDLNVISIALETITVKMDDLTEDKEVDNEEEGTEGRALWDDLDRLRKSN